MNISIRGSLAECQDAVNLLDLLASSLGKRVAEALDESTVEVVMEAEIPAA